MLAVIVWHQVISKHIAYWVRRSRNRRAHTQKSNRYDTQTDEIIHIRTYNVRQKKKKYIIFRTRYSFVALIFNCWMHGLAVLLSFAFDLFTHCVHVWVLRPSVSASVFFLEILPTIQFNSLLNGVTLNANELLFLSLSLNIPYILLITWA